MDIVKKVAEAVADIPGDPSCLEIARIAIEAYQQALWTPAFYTSGHRGMVPELRRNRASQITEAAAEIRRLRLALMAISQRMNYGTMTSEMRYAKAWADDALNEQIVQQEKP